MDAAQIERYMERIYGYAVRHTFSSHEADELAQEILFTAVRELPKLQNPERFEPWLWGVAANVTKTFRRFMGKQRAMYCYGLPVDLPDDSHDDSENEEVYAALRSGIAMLSAIYREIVIFHYYDGLSTKQIAEKLQIPEGTVTWRLHTARSKLKRECFNMEQTALKPVKLQIRINGSGEYNGTTKPFPHVYISDALSQNILYSCYQAPKTVEELAKLCGVPAYYVEDRIGNLLAREAVSEPSKGRFQTMFLIYDDQVSAYTDRVSVLFEPLLEKFAGALTTLADRVRQLGVYTANKGEHELLYLYGLLALDCLKDRYNPVDSVAHPVRYDGCRWCYHAHLLPAAQHPARGLGVEASLNLASRGRYAHYSYHFDGFSYRRMMQTDEINVCEDVLNGCKINDMDAAASAIAGGYMVREADGGCKVCVPAFTKEQKTHFDRWSQECFAACMSDYVAAVKQYVSGYKKLFPAHLQEDVTRACSSMFVTLFATVICPAAQKKGLLAPPAAGSICDVLLEHA